MTAAALAAVPAVPAVAPAAQPAAWSTWRPPVAIALFPGELWCTRCGQTSATEDEHCPFCGSKQRVDPRTILQPEEWYEG
jgi:hypothetical protein